MYSHGFIEELVCALLLFAGGMLGMGIWIGSARAKRLVARADGALTGDPAGRLDTVSAEVHELRAQVADLTLMVHDAKSEN